jgi:hypothetical protein
MHDDILTDHGSVFLSKYWQGACTTNQINLQATGIESHNSLGKGETLHARLRHAYEKIRLEHPDVQPTLALSLAVQAGNDTTNEDGLCPALLVFGVLPKIPDEIRLLQHQRDRVQAMHLARREFQRQVTRSGVVLGQKLKPPASSLHK